MAGHGIDLCALQDIPDPGGRGFRIPGYAPFFVLRHGASLVAYENNCPHQGTPLDWKPDSFLSYDRSMILCATHGAVFRITDGHCLAGPCVGQSLAPVAVRLRKGRIVLAC